MANLWLGNATTSPSFQWRAEGLGSPFNQSNYIRVAISTGTTANGSLDQPSGIIDHVDAPVSGSSTSTPTRTIYSYVSVGNTYTFYSYAKSTNERWYLVGSASITIPSPQPPTSLTGLRGNGASRSSVNLYWNSSTRAVGYHVYRGGTYLGSTSNTYFTAIGLNEYTSYNFTVIPYASGGIEGGSQTVSVRTLDETAPSLYLTEVNGSASQITFSWTASDAHSGLNYFEVYISVENSTTLYFRNTLSSGVRSHTFNVDANGLNFVVGSTYRIGVRATDNEGNQTGILADSITIVSTRPQNWAWSSTKNQGGNFNITASEWNSFFAKINEFRRYKIPQSGNYTFTSAQRDMDFYAHMYNQARSAISPMNPTTVLPPLRSVGNNITAADINRLRDSLNSVA